MSNRFDATLKDIVTRRPSAFVAAFGLSTITPATTLNVDLSTITAATDVALGFGDPLQEIADINFQVGTDASLAGRMLLYNAALHRDHGVPVRSIAVLLRKTAEMRSLTGKLAYGNEECGVEFRYRVIRMWQQPLEPFLHADLAILPLATLCQLPPDVPMTEAMREVIRAIDHRLGKEASHAEAKHLMTAAYILTVSRVPKTEVEPIFEGVHHMQEITAYDEWVEEIHQGEERGRVEGRLRGKIETLIQLGREKFGSSNAEAEAELNALHDLERINRLNRAILSAASWQELLATP